MGCGCEFKFIFSSDQFNHYRYNVSWVFCKCFGIKFSFIFSFLVGIQLEHEVSELSFNILCTDTLINEDILLLNCIWVLRNYTQCFFFGLLVIKVIGKIFIFIFSMVWGYLLERNLLSDIIKRIDILGYLWHSLKMMKFVIGIYFEWN